MLRLRFLAGTLSQFLIDGDTCLKEKNNRLAQKRAELAKPHDVKVGDIFRCSWGYDQTNIDYYQVVELKGKRGVMIREICAMSETIGFAQGVCVPEKNTFKGEAMLKKINERGSIRIASYASAHRITPKKVAGVEVFESSSWTAYA